MSQNIDVVIVDETITSQAFLEHLQTAKAVKFVVKDDIHLPYYKLFIQRDNTLVFATKYPSLPWTLYVETFPLAVFIFHYSLSDHELARYHILTFQDTAEMMEKYNDMFCKLTGYQEFTAKSKASKYLGIDEKIL